MVRTYHALGEGQSWAEKRDKCLCTLAQGILYGVPGVEVAFDYGYGRVVFDILWYLVRTSSVQSELVSGSQSFDVELRACLTCSKSGLASLPRLLIRM